MLESVSKWRCSASTVSEKTEKYFVCLLSLAFFDAQNVGTEGVEWNRSRAQRSACHSNPQAVLTSSQRNPSRSLMSAACLRTGAEPRSHWKLSPEGGSKG